MAAPFRRYGANLIMLSALPKTIQESIKNEAYQFNLVQLMRILYLSQTNRNEKTTFDQRLIGYEAAPADEIVRFKSSPKLRHSSTDIREIELLDDDRYAVTVSFIGLNGAAGVLPYHYSQMVLERLKDDDETMMNFFDLFHHRIISNYVRASTKYRLPFQHEIFSRFRTHVRIPQSSTRVEKDAISRSISCLVGLGDYTVQNRQSIDDRTLMYFGGQFAGNRPTMLGLTRMLGEFVGTTVKILQFQFEWLYLDRADQTDLGNSTKRLGSNTVIGSRVGSYQNRFQIRLGPVSWSRFQELLPSGDRLRAIAELTRSYVGIGLDFDFQVVLNGKDVPCMQLGNKACGQLGWNTWVTNGEMAGEIEDAVFEVKDDFNSS